ncbi:MAG: carbamoyltransferase C-terminal domain-containing protein [Pseudonocardiaceae bacterium]
MSFGHHVEVAALPQDKQDVWLARAEQLHCLESQAESIFSPGTPDPYMLFDHQVRQEYLTRIPAVVHLDGTARLQTVNEFDDPFLASLLEEYSKLSGMPALCNTSANYSGCGFFPDVCSAAEWGRLERIWNGGYLYGKRNSSDR